MSIFYNISDKSNGYYMYFNQWEISFNLGWPITDRVFESTIVPLLDESLMVTLRVTVAKCRFSFQIQNEVIPAAKLCWDRVVNARDDHSDSRDQSQFRLPDIWPITSQEIDQHIFPTQWKAYFRPKALQY